MNRRDFIKYLLATPIAMQLDVEQLLWVPEKKIFLVEGTRYKQTLSEIIAIELERAIPAMRALFERDDSFYRHLEKFTHEPFTNQEVAWIEDEPIVYPKNWKKISHDDEEHDDE